VNSIKMSNENQVAGLQVAGYRTVQVTDLREILRGQHEAIFVQSNNPEDIDLGVYHRIVRLYEDETIKVTLIIIPEEVRVVRLTNI
jgi:hypothetical protein